MTPPQSRLADIENPLEGSDWGVSRPDDEGALHAEVLRELCDGGALLHVGAARERGVAATLQLVDVLQHQLILSSGADGIAIARALQARPAWAAASLNSLRVQFALMAARATREAAGDGGRRFLIQAHWPREIYRTSRRRASRLACPARAPRHAPVARFLHSNQLVSMREFAVVNLSESGAAVLLPAGMVPPAPGSRIRRIELELDDERTVFTDACVLHVSGSRRGMHRVGCRWEGMPGSEQMKLRRWLAAAGEPTLAAAALERG
jgi:hypothetical protein